MSSVTKASFIFFLPIYIPSNSAFHFFICLHNFSTYFKVHSNINTSSKIDLIEHLVIQPFTSLLPSTHPHTYSTRTHESSYIQCPASILWSFMILFIFLGNPHIYIYNKFYYFSPVSLMLIWLYSPYRT